MIHLNELQTLLQLLLVLSQYEDFVILYDDFKDELVELIAKSGMEAKFLKRLGDYLQQLMENGDAAIGPPGAPMEHLTGQSPLCSMRFKLGISNVRILFTCLDNQVYLLCAFYERQGHRNTEYDAYIPIARSRLKDLMEGE